jgi:hypothetical protein
MTAKAENGSSPLLTFKKTWRNLDQVGDPFDLELVTNRNFDNRSALFKALDKKSDRLDLTKLKDGLNRPRTDLGKVITDFADHLDLDRTAVVKFLSDVTFRNEGSENAWRGRISDKMRLNGFRGDENAVTIALRMVSDWVTDGVGRITVEEARRRLEDLDLLARNGILVLAVHGIDREDARELPNARVDFTDLYPDSDPFQRRSIADPADWDAVVLPRLSAAAKKLEAFRSRRVHVVASVRLPVWFAIGRALPGVRRWVISLDQDGTEWASNSRGGSAQLVTVSDEPLHGTGADLVVCVALRHDPTTDVRRYVAAAGLPAGRLYTVTGETGIGPEAVTRRCLGKLMDGGLAGRADRQGKRDRRRARASVHGRPGWGGHDARPPVERPTSGHGLRAPSRSGVRADLPLPSLIAHVRRRDCRHPSGLYADAVPRIMRGSQGTRHRSRANQLPHPGGRNHQRPRQRPILAAIRAAPNRDPMRQPCEASPPTVAPKAVVSGPFSET